MTIHNGLGIYKQEIRRRQSQHKTTKTRYKEQKRTFFVIFTTEGYSFALAHAFFIEDIHGSASHSNLYEPARGAD